MTAHAPVIWLVFAAVITLLLVVDLGILNRHAHVLKHREAALWTGGLVLIALAFCGFLWYREGQHHALEFLTGYLVELALSVDNLFVFILVFEYFAVPASLQPTVLNWGIFGAMLMRGLMISLGALLLLKFEFIIYLFGAVLIYTGSKMFRSEEMLRVEPERNPVVRLARRLLPFRKRYDGSKFFSRTNRGLFATPLLLVLLIVEWTDLVFAIDSIPAIFAITRDPFIVYSSNIFAVLGLRALFFLLAGMLESFAYLKPAVALVLVYIGLKMILSHWVHPPIGLSLGVIVLMLTGGIVLSLLRRPPPVAADR